jgi:hypothetical protein
MAVERCRAFTANYSLFGVARRCSRAAEHPKSLDTSLRTLRSLVREICLNGGHLLVRDHPAMRFPRFYPFPRTMQLDISSIIMGHNFGSLSQ